MLQIILDFDKYVERREIGAQLKTLKVSQYIPNMSKHFLFVLNSI